MTHRLQGAKCAETETVDLQEANTAGDPSGLQQLATVSFIHDD